MSDIVTEDRKCRQCGTPVESFEGEPAEQVNTSGGLVITLSMWYTLRPCGHTFKLPLNVRKEVLWI